MAMMTQSVLGAYLGICLWRVPGSGLDSVAVMGLVCYTSITKIDWSGSPI